MISEGEAHQCQMRLDQEVEGGISNEPLENPDLTLYVDGSRRYINGQFWTGWAVADQNEEAILKGGLEGTLSVQIAELIALTESLKAAKGKRVNMYTDSRYAFGVVHDYMAAWNRRNFITSGGGHIRHEKVVQELVEAARVPAEVAVIKIQAHRKVENQQQRGNMLADAVAKEAAEKEEPRIVRVAAYSPEEMNVQKLQGYRSRGEGATLGKD
ncbi:ribonuclease H-like [Carcharodon carcharias]|uniref:ribonuclease H-like n=1 Tax=Carcharodon carcharias TaxID=13397 RepID=UPI001B7E6C1E|nr:ribonuclease H-like [Carcharodon carcharias]